MKISSDEIQRLRIRLEIMLLCYISTQVLREYDVIKSKKNITPQKKKNNLFPWYLLTDVIDNKNEKERKEKKRGYNFHVTTMLFYAQRSPSIVEFRTAEEYLRIYQRTDGDNRKNAS